MYYLHFVIETHTNPLDAKAMKTKKITNFENGLIEDDNRQYEIEMGIKPKSIKPKKETKKQMLFWASFDVNNK